MPGCGISSRSRSSGPLLERRTGARFPEPRADSRFPERRAGATLRCGTAGRVQQHLVEQQAADLRLALAAILDEEAEQPPDAREIRDVDDRAACTARANQAGARQLS